MFFLGIAILLAALIPLFIVAALTVAALSSLAALIGEHRSAALAPAKGRTARPAQSPIARVSRTTPRGAV